MAIELPFGFHAEAIEDGAVLDQGELKYRVDLFPPLSSPLYERLYVEHFDRAPTEEELADPDKLALIPKHKSLNPCLIHLLAIAADTTKQQLEAKIRDIFDVPTLVLLENRIMAHDGEEVVRVMGSPGKRGQSPVPIVVVDEESRKAFIDQVNRRFRGGV